MRTTLATASGTTLADLPRIFAAARDRLDGLLMRAFPTRGPEHLAVLAWFDRLAAGQSAEMPAVAADCRTSGYHAGVYHVCRAASVLRSSVERLELFRADVAAQQVEVDAFAAQWPAPHLTERISLQHALEERQCRVDAAARRVRRILSSMS